MNREIESAQSVEELRQIPVPPAEAEGAESRGSSDNGTVLGRVKAAFGSRTLRLSLVFLAGLLAGWLVLGWWLWPVQWTNALPWHLQPAYQERYLELVAETFWHSKDIRAAQQALEGWDEEKLAALLKKAQQQAATEEEHEQIAALAEALQYPTYETSIWTSLADRKGIVGGAAVSAILFMAAGVLGVYSLVGTSTEESVEVVSGEALPEEAGALDVEPGANEPEEEMPDDVEEGDGLVVGAIDEDEDDFEEDEDFYDAEEDFYEEGEDLVDSLSAFMFDEEEEDISHLKELCERLPEIDTDELLEEARDVAEELRRGIELRAQEPRF